jgi:Fe2+ or Zn2+ uptake regulation protein
MTSLFRARGLKVTPQRECIFEVVHGNVAHPTAEAVYAEARSRMPTMSLKTVYQTLNDLADMGEIQLLNLGTGSARFDPNVDCHHHMVCTRCGDVRDVQVDVAALDVPLVDRAGFVVRSTDVVFRGLCAACQQAPSPAS